MPSTRKQLKAKVSRSREADLLSHIENMDLLISSSHFGGIQKKIAGESRNSEVSGSSNGNEIRTYNRTDGHELPITSETLERRLETMAIEVNTRIA